MKKTYIAPSIDIFEMKLNNMIAASVNSLTSTEAGTGSESVPVNLAPELPGLSDDELFQFIMIH